MPAIELWPPSAFSLGRLQVQEPSLSFTDLTPKACFALFSVRSEISASRALRLTALDNTGNRPSSEIRNSLASVRVDFSSSSAGTLRSCPAVASDTPSYTIRAAPLSAVSIL